MKYDLPPSDRERYHRCRFKPETYEFGFLEDAVAGNNKFTRKNSSSRLVIRDEFIRVESRVPNFVVTRGSRFSRRRFIGTPLKSRLRSSPRALNLV